ncbi:alpha/beta hydrolase fold domain-containing protein [Nocardia sp. NPDC058519]|uniref:alpha/beta hydrolase fold domain-containing protein n=1 Tax=Nocardia sp. NPDC058519 TaxID=3346535 RepID=UPI00364EFD8A
MTTQSGTHETTLLTAEDPVLVHRSSSRMTRITCALPPVIAKSLYRMWPLTDRGTRALTMFDTTLSWFPSARDVERTSMTLGQIPVQRYLPVGHRDHRLDGVSILYLHGGGFTFCGDGTHRRVTRRIAKSLSVPVYSVLCRQLPDYGVGTAIHDAYVAYRALLGACAEGDRVVLAGDSSGAFLAAKVCELAAADGLAMPAALVAYSPHIDLDVDLRDRHEICRDALMPVSAYRRAKRKWEKGPVAARGARSMLQVDPTAFPPTFITAAAKEMFEADIVAFARGLAAGGCAVVEQLGTRVSCAGHAVAGKPGGNGIDGRVPVTDAGRSGIPRCVSA